MGLALGIAGGTGSGKTALAQTLRRRAPAMFALLELDWYYRDQSHLALSERECVDYDEPGAVEIDRVLEDVGRVLAGKLVDAPIYDFATHTRLAETRRIEPRPVLIVEGIHALGYPALCNLYQSSVFVDTPADIRFIRRLQRDMAERGRTADSVIRQYLEQVRPMHERWVEATREQATLVVSGESSLEENVRMVLRLLKQKGELVL